MGKFKFRLSDMMPNAWFYKLKDMGKTKNHSISTKKKQQIDSSNSSNQKTQFPSYPRKSYYFSRNPVSNNNFSNSPPRKSSKRLRSRKISAAAVRGSPKTVSSSVSTGCSCRTRTNPESPVPDYSASYSSDGDDVSSKLELGEYVSPEFRTDRILTPDSFDDMVKWSRSDTKDIFIDVERTELPPIITKPDKNDGSVKFRRNSLPAVRKQGISTKEQRKSTSRSPGMKLRINNSPRIVSRRIQAGRKSGSSSSKKSLSESLAIVKSSFDPQRDFRESMVEMIVQNNIRASRDLEDLLACYLTLNSDEYHDLIIKVFKQIWFELSNQARIK